jgi:hypothetical protein
MQPDLLNDIEAFLETHDMSPTMFGELALNDRHFVKQVRGEYRSRPKRRVWPETEAKVRTFMVTYRPQEEAA